MTQAGSKAQATRLPSAHTGASPGVNPQNSGSVDALMRAARWVEAATLLQKGPGQDLASMLKLRLARNMAALQARRPDIYQILTSTPLSGRYQITAAPDGNLTISLMRPGQPPCCLSDQGQPSKALAKLAGVAKDPANQYHVLALLGLGDGYFLSWLAQNIKPDALGMILPTYLIEPEPEVLYQAMTLHDWSGPQGPIAQARFIWAVGAAWESMLQKVLDAEPQLRHPSMQIHQSILAAQITARLGEVMMQDKAKQDAARKRVRDLYDGHTPQQLLTLLGDRPPRKPRLLCCTSRFSTVVQYVATDVARAMARLGWETRILTDKAPHLVVGVSAVLAAMEDFKPDVAFTVNHLRAETGLGDGFPTNMPYVCWIQDHTRALMNKAMGATVAKRDFVLSESPQQYVENFGYPQRQCITMPKLTATVELPRSEEQDGEDLVYVSHASGRPEQHYEELCAKVKTQYPRHHELVSRCGRRLLDLYAGGKACSTIGQMQALLESVAKESSLPLPEQEQWDVICQAMYVPLNNALYRQQTLAWIAEAADKLGLRLGIYGAGWESHPRLGRYARGKIGFGRDLQALTRRSRINFQIVPYAFYHQRLFEGVMAGGFFLVRRNPDDLTAAHNLRQQGLFRGEFPDLYQVGFADQATLMNLIKRFVAAPEVRAPIVARQRYFVMENFTYDRGARRLVEQMRERIAAEME